MTVYWHQIVWHMLRHLCGPKRAVEHELARRYGRARGWHLPPEVRAAELRQQAEDAPIIRWPRDLPLHRTEAGYPNCSTCDGGGCPDCTDPA